VRLGWVSARCSGCSQSQLDRWTRDTRGSAANATAEEKTAGGWGHFDDPPAPQKERYFHERRHRGAAPRRFPLEK
jgi:hypothetical protein